MGTAAYSPASVRVSLASNSTTGLCEDTVSRMERARPSAHILWWPFSTFQRTFEPHLNRPAPDVRDTPTLFCTIDEHAVKQRVALLLYVSAYKRKQPLRPILCKEERSKCVDLQVRLMSGRGYHVTVSAWASVAYLLQYLCTSCDEFQSVDGAEVEWFQLRAFDPSGSELKAFACVGDADAQTRGLINVVVDADACPPLVPADFAVDWVTVPNDMICDVRVLLA